MKHHKIIITGTGRAGTTVLVKLLTILNLPTGFNAMGIDSLIAKSGGGLEHYNTGPHQGPKIVKAPQYWNQIPQMANWYDVKLVVVPIRDLHDSAASRASLPNGSPGSLWEASNKNEQEDHNAKVIYQIVRDCTANGIPMLFLDFPRIATDWEYLYNKLKPLFILCQRLPAKEKFRMAFNQVMDPSKVKSYGKS